MRIKIFDWLGMEPVRVLEDMEIGEEDEDFSDPILTLEVPLEEADNVNLNETLYLKSGHGLKYFVLIELLEQDELGKARFRSEEIVNDKLVLTMSIDEEFYREDE